MAKALSPESTKKPYSLPWLIMVGTDGSGKTGWLTDVGFEQISVAAAEKSSDICFWLGENAVVIELAGHYYTREKDPVNESLWLHLIHLLHITRPRQPITGIIAALSMEQLVTRQHSGLAELARQLRWRLQELNRLSGLCLPSWLLLTQADRLNGFTEYFQHTSSQKQSLPWGFSLPDGYREDHFRNAFLRCHRSLCDALPECLYHARGYGTRQAQIRFVLQFDLLGERLDCFCEELFLSRHGLPDPKLSGVWFSSCGQYGNSINVGYVPANSCIAYSLCLQGYRRAL